MNYFGREYIFQPLIFRGVSGDLLLSTMGLNHHETTFWENIFLCIFFQASNKPIEVMYLSSYLPIQEPFHKTKAILALKSNKILATLTQLDGNFVCPTTIECIWQVAGNPRRTGSNYPSLKLTYHLKMDG